MPYRALSPALAAFFWMPSKKTAARETTGDDVGLCTGCPFSSHTKRGLNKSRLDLWIVQLESSLQEMVIWEPILVGRLIPCLFYVFEERGIKTAIGILRKPRVQQFLYISMPVSLHDCHIAPVTFQGGHKQTTIYSFFLFLSQRRYGP